MHAADAIILSTLYVCYIEALQVKKQTMHVCDLRPEGDTVDYLHELLELGGIPRAQMDLIYKGVNLEPHVKLFSYNIKDGDTIWLKSPLINTGFSHDDQKNKSCNNDKENKENAGPPLNSAVEEEAEEDAVEGEAKVKAEEAEESEEGPFSVEESEEDGTHGRHRHHTYQHEIELMRWLEAGTGHRKILKNCIAWDCIMPNSSFPSMLEPMGLSVGTYVPVIGMQPATPELDNKCWQYADHAEPKILLHGTQWNCLARLFIFGPLGARQPFQNDRQ